MKRIIFNADDFGLSSGANRGIIRAWKEGVLTSTSLMVEGNAFDEAVELAREHSGLQVGLHLTLVQGRSVLPQCDLPGLVDAERRFTDNPVKAGMRYFFLKPLREQLRREIEAQILKFQATGIPLSHIDGHLNIHMQPVVFDLLMELMPKHGISTFRLTQERFFSNLAVDPGRKIGKGLDAFIFSRLATRCRPALDAAGIGYTAEVKGLLSSGRMTEKYLLQALDDLKDGLTEIYFHPGCLPCEEISLRMPDYRHEEELAALTSPQVRGKLVRLGVHIQNYRGEEKSLC